MRNLHTSYLKLLVAFTTGMVYLQSSYSRLGKLMNEKYESKQLAVLSQFRDFL